MLAVDVGQFEDFEAPLTANKHEMSEMDRNGSKWDRTPWACSVKIHQTNPVRTV